MPTQSIPHFPSLAETDSPPHNHLLRNRIAQLHPHPSPAQHIDPQPLRIAQPIVLALHLREHDLPLVRVPQEQIRDAAPPLLVLLRHDLAHGTQRLGPETLRDLDEIGELEAPIEADDARLPPRLRGVRVAEDGGGGAVGDGVETRVDLGGARGVEGVRVQVERARLEGRLEDVGHVGEEDVVEEVGEERAQDAAFAVIALPAQRAVVAEAHGLDAAFVAVAVVVGGGVEPDGFAAAAAVGRRSGEIGAASPSATAA